MLYIFQSNEQKLRSLIQKIKKNSLKPKVERFITNASTLSCKSIDDDNLMKLYAKTMASLVNNTYPTLDKTKKHIFIVTENFVHTAKENNNYTHIIKSIYCAGFKHHEMTARKIAFESLKKVSEKSNDNKLSKTLALDLLTENYLFIPIKHKPESLEIIEQLINNDNNPNHTHNFYRLDKLLEFYRGVIVDNEPPMMHMAKKSLDRLYETKAASPPEIDTKNIETCPLVLSL